MLRVSNTYARARGTAYGGLSEEEKASDREWADKVLSLPGIQPILEKAEKWDMLVPLLKEGDEEEAIEVYMARAKTAFLTDTLGKCLLRKERLEAIKTHYYDLKNRKLLLCAEAHLHHLEELLEGPR